MATDRLRAFPVVLVTLVCGMRGATLRWPVGRVSIPFDGMVEREIALRREG